MTKSYHNQSMICLLTVLVLLLANSCSSVKPVKSPDLNDLTERAVKSTVSIHNLEGRLVCAGTRISETELVTAYHCAIAGALTEDEQMRIDMEEEFRGEPNFSFYPPSKVIGKSIQYAEFLDMTDDDPNHLEMIKRLGVVSAINAKSDVVIITTEKSNQPHAEIKEYRPKLSATVFAVGHPRGFSYSVTFGRVSYPSRILYGRSWIHVDLSILGGNSGGGLYDQDGYLIGVCSMGLGQVHGFYSPIENAQMIR